MTIKRKENKMIEKTLEILKSKKDAFLKNVEKFNKKAVKLGVVPMDIEFGEDKVHSYYEDETAELWGVLTKIAYQEITVKYEIPKISGWDLVAVFDYEDFVDENEKLQRAVFTNAVPGKEVPFKYQDKNEIHCEHCGHNRFRKKSFLVQHEEGEYKEVGSTCLKDFLGHDPQNFLWFAGMEDRISGMEDEFGLGSFGVDDPISYDLLGILSLTNAIIKKYGWTSRGEAYDDEKGTKVATADDVLNYLTTKNKTESEKIYPEKEDVEIAGKTLEYFKTLENQDNDYIMNCLRVVKMNRVTHKRLGIACSMIQVYRRHVEKEIERANELPSEWFGNIGSKLENCEVLCTFKTHCETMYGTSTLYKFMDNDGNIFKTFYSGYTWSVEQEERVKIWGTVKKHDEWNEKKETMLTRCKVQHQ
jgi:DNA-directed RNA polymerase subunit RPC12/RpoP